MKRWFYILISASLLALSPLQESLGGAFAIGENGVEGLGANPASIVGNDNHSLSVHATKYWLGLGDENILGSRIAFVPASKRWGAVGIEFKYLSAGVQGKLGLALGYSSKIQLGANRSLALGISGKWIRNQYNSSEFYRFEEDPLFDSFGTASDGFGLDAGVLFYYRDLNIGICAINTLSPSLSIEASEDGSKEPTAFAFGASYKMFKLLVPTAQLVSSDGEIDITGGIELLLLDGLLGIRAGYREEGFSFGLGLSGRTKLPIRFDYAMLYPSGAMSKAGLSTHWAGLTIEISPKTPASPHEPTLKDTHLYADMAVITDTTGLLALEIGQSRKFKARIANLGLVSADSTFASVFALSGDSLLVGLPFKIPPLDSKESREIEWEWTPKFSGKGYFLISADDDGSRFPIRNGRVTEVDVSNNRAKIPFYVSGTITAKITVQHERFTIPQLTYIADEEPLVPVVFFEKDGVELSDRFSPTLDAISRRLLDNPDIELVLKGFVDSTSEDSQWFDRGVHTERARAVQGKINKIAPEAAIVQSDNYDPTAPRIRPLGKSGSIEDAVWAQQENRRVEMSTRLQGFEDDLLNTGELAVSTQMQDSLRAIAPTVRRFIERNPETAIIFESTINSESQWRTANELLEQLRLEFVTASGMTLSYDLMPIFIKIEEASEPILRVHLTGEGLIYRPKEAALAAKDFEIPRDKRENTITISLGEGIVTSYIVSVVDQNSNRIRQITNGEGIPPLNIKWDWRDDNGNLVDPRKRYRIELNLTDPVGQSWKSYSPEISLEVIEKEIRRESTIIVQFAFDEVTSTSKFLESRIEAMARKIVSLGGKPDSRINVKILGHTDPIGTDRRNTILSQERAQEEETAIRRYLRQILDLKSDSALERWLADNRITLVRQGLADTQPYEVERYRDGKFEKVLLGNNAFPEGRAANRRVIIQIEEIRNSTN